MKVVILNWNGGENDPFTLVNETIGQHFRLSGKLVEVVEISTNDWPHTLKALLPGGVEFAFTWQGLGSAVTLADGTSLWDKLRIPLACVHADHPSHMPANHALESPYCFHLYTNAEFARYSNRHFRRSRGAAVIDVPFLHRDRPLSGVSGDWFVVAKNLDDPQQTERTWREEFERPLSDAYLVAAETVRSMLTREPYVEFHDVLDNVIAMEGFDFLRSDVDVEAHHQYHSQLDFYVHAHKALTVVEALRDLPLRIYGRGWDRVARSAPSTHAFFPGRKMAESQPLYYSRFGIIDIAPAKGLSDRTRRAMVNGTAFLSSANLEDSFSDIERYSRMFYDFRPDTVVSKCEAVMRDPESHVLAVREFANAYHDRFHFRNFVERLEALARSVSNAA